MVTVGRIIRPHGIRGEVVVGSETDFGDERFQSGAALFTWRDDRLATLTVESGREHDGRWLVKFAGVETRNDAEDMRGLELRIDAGALKPLGAGAFYVHDLIGCRVERVTGEVIGPVTRVDLAVGIPMLVATDADGGEVLIPLTAAICREVDIVGRKIVIDPPAGLIELNRKTRPAEGRNDR
jgi:16S rRNA processing protein RimM